MAPASEAMAPLLPLGLMSHSASQGTSYSSADSAEQANTLHSPLALTTRLQHYTTSTCGLPPGARTPGFMPQAIPLDTPGTPI